MQDIFYPFIFFLSLSKIKFFSPLKYLFCFSEHGETWQNSHGVKCMTFKKIVPPYLYILIPHEYLLKIIISDKSNNNKNISPFRMFLAEIFLPQKIWNPNKTIKKKYMVIFVLEENATLEIILNYVTKHPNIMLMPGGRKEESFTFQWHFPKL